MMTFYFAKPQRVSKIWQNFNQRVVLTFLQKFSAVQKFDKILISALDRLFCENPACFRTLWRPLWKFRRPSRTICTPGPTLPPIRAVGRFGCKTGTFFRPSSPLHAPTQDAYSLYLRYDQLVEKLLHKDADMLHTVTANKIRLKLNCTLKMCR